MKVDDNLTRNLANAANAMNAIYGGAVFPVTVSTKEADHYIVEVSVPSLSADDLKVEVDGNQLFVFQMIEVSQVPMPNVLSLLPLSRRINIDHITASFSEHTLRVILPFDEFSGDDQRREIDVQSI